MKRLKIELIALLLIGIALCTGCGNDNSQQQVDINGEWTGHLLMDSYGTERTADSSYILNIVQDENNLTGSLTIPEEFGINNSISLSGIFNSETTFTMEGTENNSLIRIYGAIEDKHSLQISIDGVESKTQFVFLHKDFPLTSSFDNSYKLDLKLAGNGRSVILIHGMDDNAETWNTMIDYFREYGVNLTTKATGTLNILPYGISQIVFNVADPNNPSIKGTATAVVSNMSNSVSISIISTTIPGVSRFKTDDSDDFYELNTSVAISPGQSSVNITLLGSENAVGNVWVFEYKWWDHISDNATVLLNMIETKQNNGDITSKPLIIAHSMGGLVSRSYIAQGGDFYRLVTLGTPHLGSDLSHFVPFGSVSGVGDLKPGSDFLNDLNSKMEFQETQRSNYWLINGRTGTYPSCYHLGIATCYQWYTPEPTSVEKAGYAYLSKPNDGMVPQSSARFEVGVADIVNRIDTFEWIDHKSLNSDYRVCQWVTDFIMKNQ